MAMAPKLTKSASLYNILGVDTNATEEQIRFAYKKRAVQTHPDKPGGSEATFRTVRHAYEVLHDPRTRENYDALLKAQAQVRRFAMMRPKPLSEVKVGMAFNLMDGMPYTFETAPDRMRVRFRHGDVVQDPKGNQGIIIGLASDGIYWCPNRCGTARLLFSSDFGGDKDIILIHRERPIARNNSAPYLNEMRNREAERQAGARERQRRFEQAQDRIVADEAKARRQFLDAVDGFLCENLAALRSWEQVQKEAVFPSGEILKIPKNVKLSFHHPDSEGATTPPSQPTSSLAPDPLLPPKPTMRSMRGYRSSPIRTATPTRAHNPPVVAGAKPPEPEARPAIPPEPMVEPVPVPKVPNGIGGEGHKPIPIRPVLFNFIQKYATPSPQSPLRAGPRKIPPQREVTRSPMRRPVTPGRPSSFTFCDPSKGNETPRRPSTPVLRTPRSPNFDEVNMCARQPSNSRPASPLPRCASGLSNGHVNGASPLTVRRKEVERMLREAAARRHLGHDDLLEKTL